MKKLVLLASIFGAVGFASASELWWTIGDSPTLDGQAITEWSVAKVYASADGYNYGGTELPKSWSKEEIGDWGYAFSTLPDTLSSAKSFYVELYNSTTQFDESTFVGRSYVTLPSEGAPQGAADLTASIASSVMSTPTVYSFNMFTTSKVVPEPTTGLLMLFGLAGLALRRRRA